MSDYIERLLGMALLAALRESRPVGYWRLWGYTVWGCDWPEGLWSCA